MAEQRMRNPFQSEEDAFYVLVVILIAAAIVIASALLINTTVGAALAVLAIALGLWKSAGWLGIALGEPDEDPPADDSGNQTPESTNDAA